MGVRRTPAFITLLSVLGVTSSQLPHTIDLTWFQQTEVPYKFQEFPYFETRKNEALFREYVKACEQTPSCCHLEGVEQTSCVRQCISPTCYTILYAQDLLEDGEIDLRLNSFKGCFHQQLETRKTY